MFFACDFCRKSRFVHEDSISALLWTGCREGMDPMLQRARAWPAVIL